VSERPASDPHERALEEAGALMREFAARTGLDSDRPPKRYLWTDAFAVCNFLALWRATGVERFRQLAVDLVDQVHRVLGRHRPDDPRQGWISGLAESEALLHPTRGGLRIGKPLPERAADAPFDERLEWERDGQYFHYLTRWMHALDQLARWTGEPRSNTWARELAETAHRAFTRGSGADRRMPWKLSIDLSRALVPSMGQHDPLDGFVSCLELRATATRCGGPPRPDLAEALSDYAALAAGCRWETADPLGLGGLLVDAGLVAQLMAQGAVSDGGLLLALLDATLVGLAHFERQGELRQPAARRLAFRELGLAIGLAALDPIGQALRSAAGRVPHAAGARVEALEPYARLGAGIVAVWRDPAQRSARGWLEHADINDVMLATALVPEGALRLEPPPAAS